MGIGVDLEAVGVFGCDLAGTAHIGDGARLGHLVACGMPGTLTIRWSLLRGSGCAVRQVSALTLRAVMPLNGHSV